MTAAVLVVACTLWHECRGEPQAGKAAVASVIANRSRASGRTPAAECRRPRQFSCWNKRPTLAAAMPSVRARETRAWRDCLALAERVQGGTLRAAGPWTHYCRHDYRPAWRRAATREEVIGKHVFVVL